MRHVRRPSLMITVAAAALVAGSWGCRRAKTIPGSVVESPTPAPVATPEAPAAPVAGTDTNPAWEGLRIGGSPTPDGEASSPSPRPSGRPTPKPSLGPAI